MTVADKIKELREKEGLSQEELAHKMGLKSRSSITRIEKSGDNVSLKDVERFSEFFGVSPLYLMGWVDENGVSIENKQRENEIIDLYNQLSPEKQLLVQGLIEAFLERQ